MSTAIVQCAAPASRHTPSASASGKSRPPIKAAILATACAGAVVAAWSLRGTPYVPWAFLVAYLAGMAVAIANALRALLVGKLTIDLLMIVAAAGAGWLNDWSEGAVLLFLFSASGALEDYAMYRTRRSIDSLVKLRPRDATRVTGGSELRVAVEQLAIHDMIRVRPGERFAVDGTVLEGETWADEATITGESRPVHKTPGSTVFAGTINGHGCVLVRMTRAVTDTTLERIVRLVQEAQSQKAPTQKFVEAWQHTYVAVVFAAFALTLAGSWYLHDRDLSDAFYHAMVLLVVASPCAVVASSPAAVLSAIARAARCGILFKGGAALESLGQIGVIAFDKTGTITVGKPAVANLYRHGTCSDEDLLRLAAAVERNSEHPLAASIAAETQRRALPMSEAKEFEYHTGQGVHARVDGIWVGVGREDLFASHGIRVPADVLEHAKHCRQSGQTALLVASDNGVAGAIAVADQLRPEARTALSALRSLGVNRQVILTGDHVEVANAVAASVGADDVCAQLLPEQKVIELRRIMDKHGPIAMVGDGVNDAPALAAATVGVAMGGAGTDVALEVADVVLMRDNLLALPLAIWLGRRAAERVRQNLTFSLGVIGFLVLSTFFGLPLWLGVIGHEGSTLLVVLNGLRILWEKPPRF